MTSLSSEQTPERILLVRLSALGDCVVSIPVFLSLRKQYPHAHIAWVIQDNFAPLIRNLPGLDEIIVFPRRRWKNLSSKMQLLREAKLFHRHIRGRHFDLVVDTQSNLKSSGIAWLTRSPQRIGHGSVEGKEGSAWLNNKLVDPQPHQKHVVERNLNLLSALNIAEETPEFILPPCKTSRRNVLNWLGEQELKEGGYVLLVPFCGNEIKEWSPSHFTQLAANLVANGINVIFNNSPGDVERTLGLIPTSTNTHSSAKACLGPQTSILELVELIRSAGVVVGGDTGPIQLSGAMAVPSIALFGPTASERSRPWKSGTIVDLSSSPEPITQTITSIMRQHI